MRSIVALAAVIAATVGAEGAPRKRALIVGIDQYAPPPGQTAAPGREGWFDLQGAVEDAKSIREVLVGRFGFRKGDVMELYNERATRDAIMGGLRKLAKKSRRGDVAFFYYAGHGSRMYNSLSKETDRLDETLVPADAWRGAFDIRDKELNKLLNAVLDRKAELVAVFDSCHSGSVSRGPGGAGPFRARYIEPQKGADAKDPSDPPAPASRGALVLAAAQDSQLAWEAHDERAQPRGLFTLSLQQALAVADPKEPVERVFQRVLGRMRSVREDQDPVLQPAQGERVKRPLFGGVSADARLTASVLKRPEDGRVQIGAGSALGLTPRTELVPADGKSSLRLAVESVDGPGTSTAMITSGDASLIEPGMPFVVDRWAAPDKPSLLVWMSDGGALKEVESRAASVFALAGKAGATWVEDPASADATHILYRTPLRWELMGPGDAGVPMGTSALDEAALSEALRAAKAKGPVRLFVNFPVPSELRNALALGKGTASPSVEAGERARAHYHLAGRYVGGRLEYAWTRPWTASTKAAPLPARTDFYAVSAAGMKPAAGELERKAVALGRINAWLTLDGPPENGFFPYRLAIEDLEAKEPSKRFIVGGKVVANTAGYSLALIATYGAPWVEPRWVYVFAIDGRGAGHLLYPRVEGDVGNRFPPEGEAPQAFYALRDSKFRVREPFGADTFFLLTTREKLPSPAALAWDPVKTRGAPPQARGDALTDMLFDVGVRTRGVGAPAPVGWWLQRVTVTTVAKE